MDVDDSAQICCTNDQQQKDLGKVKELYSYKRCLNNMYFKAALTYVLKNNSCRSELDCHWLKEAEMEEVQ